MKDMVKVNKIKALLMRGASYTEIMAQVDNVYPSQISLIKRKYLTTTPTTTPTATTTPTTTPTTPELPLKIEHKKRKPVRISYAFKVKDYLSSIGISSTMSMLKSMELNSTMDYKGVRITRVKSQTWKIW